MPKKIWVRVLFVFSILFAGCNNDDGNPVTTGSPPSINSMTPSSIARGLDHADATITGTNLNGVTAVDLGNGITVHQATASSANSISVNFSVAKNTDPGPRTISVTTPLGTANASGILTVRNNIAPTAKFVIKPSTSVSTKVTVSFDASASEDPNGNSISYRWDFGDGATDGGKRTTHKYSSTGTFNVSLTTKDNQDSANTTTKQIEVLSNAPPIAGFTVRPADATNQDHVEFDASTKSFDPDGRVKDYLWDFGDGKKKAQGAKVTRKFEPGKYTVTLTVTDNNSTTGSAEKDLTVKKLTQIKCTKPSGNHGLIFGTVVDVEGRYAIVQFAKDRTCASTFYRCGDMRRADPEQFRGIIREMYDLGNGKFKILNDCPFRWPPAIGERDFLIWKTCAENFCP